MLGIRLLGCMFAAPCIALLTLFKSKKKTLNLAKEEGRMGKARCMVSMITEMVEARDLWCDI